MPKGGIKFEGQVLAPTKRDGRVRSAISIPMILLIALLACLAFAGGASRGDALGQTLVRFAAAVAMAGLILAGRWPTLTMHRWPVAILLAMTALPLFQLIPLPPSIWSHLPGHAIFLQAANISGEAQPWRPLALSPDAAWNAFFSLLVPSAALLLTAALTDVERTKFPFIILVLSTISAAVAVLSLSGGRFDNPLINETIGAAGGVFANPNHQALLLAIGIAAASTWAADQQKAALWRLPVAGGAAIWFLLMIIASGSRTGLVLGFLSLGISIIIARPALTALLSPVPPRLRWAIVIVGVATIITLAVVSFTSGRAVSFHRLLTLSTGEDMRSRALPIVLDMVRTYMPLGSGLGSFDPLFRMYEPDALLKLTYFNHAHNDYLEVALQSGIFGIALIILIIGWGIYAGIKAWRSHPARPSQLAARFATVAMLLIAIASGVDYPARTPIIMALIAIVAILANPTSRPTDGSSALRSKGDRI